MFIRNSTVSFKYFVTQTITDCVLYISADKKNAAKVFPFLMQHLGSNILSHSVHTLVHVMTTMLNCVNKQADD